MQIRIILYNYVGTSYTARNAQAVVNLLSTSRYQDAFESLAPSLVPRPNRSCVVMREARAARGGESRLFSRRVFPARTPRHLKVCKKSPWEEAGLLRLDDNKSVTSC